MPETSRESEDSPLEDKSSSNMPASPELTSSQNADLRSVGQSRRFQSLPRDEKITLLRTNKNLGHPSPERLSTLLRAQGYRPELARAALELKCSTCMESSRPKLARPGSIRDDLDFNDRMAPSSMSTIVLIGPPVSNVPDLPRICHPMVLFRI